MTVPVLKNLVQQHRDLYLTVVSRPQYEPLFRDLERVKFFPADVNRQYRGVFGLSRLARRIRKEVPFHAVADLHDSLRTKLLRMLLGQRHAVIDKGRKERRAITRRRNKTLQPLRSVFQRYADVFSQLKFPVTLDTKTGTLRPPVDERVPAAGGRITIGVAPFANHLPKMYPLDRTREVVRRLSNLEGATVLLFGSKAEGRILADWEKDFPQVRSVAGKFDLAGELAMIARLDVMVSMDSANMHLASLYGVPVISIWGGTHPYAGFYGWGQSPDHAVQANLDCRPSSIFGNRPCPVHGLQGCMDPITPDEIVQRVKQVLSIS